MKLAKNLSIAAAGLALSFAAVGAQSAQAATVNFLGQSGGAYNYNVVATQANEILGKFSLVALTGLQGVTGVIPGSAFTSTFNPSSVTLVANSDTALTTPQTFSVISSADPGNVNFAAVNFKVFNATTGTTTGPAAVPEPMTVGGSLLAIGFGTWMKRKKAESAVKA
ncbi:MAG: PEP-CTERM sorting domain-containing protein [Gloeotrichia echinulata GP01]